jgi:serine/threonine protein kinase
MHRDIKPDNICFNPQTTLASLLDFGCMMGTDGTDYSIGGSPNYVPPELAVPAIYQTEYLCKAFTYSSSDIWLMARVVYELLFGTPPEINYL